MAFIKVKECLTNPRQLIKLILLVICICVTIYQLSGSINKMLHPPITSHYKLKFNDTIKYPAVTVCRKPSFKLNLFPRFGMSSSKFLSTNVFENFTFGNSTLSEFVEATTYDLGETIPLWAFKGQGLGSNVEFRSAVYIDHGRCHTIIPREPADAFTVKAGYWLYLKHNSIDTSKNEDGLSTSGFEIHIHQEKDVKDQKAMDFNFLYLEAKENMYVRLTMQVYNQISTSQQPCSLEFGYSKSKCEEECYHNRIAETVGCTVPWLHSKKNYSECTDHLAINKISELFSNRRKQEILATCDCPQSCNNSYFSYQIESRREADAIQAPSSTLSLYFGSNLVTELAEVISFDWNVFLADVGGSLGFLLGLSVIGAVGVIEEAIKLVIRKKEKKVEKQPELPVGGTAEGESLKDVMEFMANCDKYQHKMAEQKY